MKTNGKSLLALAFLVVAVPALSQKLPGLPKDQALPRGDGSPGVVTFRHETHVDADKPNCTVCHPKLFPILKRREGAPPAPVMKHADMEKGRLCGSCHDGKAAHGFDDCATCHDQK